MQAVSRCETKVRVGFNLICFYHAVIFTWKLLKLVDKIFNNFGDNFQIMVHFPRFTQYSIYVETTWYGAEVLKKFD